MASLQYIFKNDYDKRIKLVGEHVFCYSKKKMKELYSEKNYSIVGEASSTLVKQKKQENTKKPEEKVGKLAVGKQAVDVFVTGKHKKGLYKNEGYLCVGEDAFVTVHTSRVLFLTALVALIALLAVTVFLIIRLLASPEPPIVIDPDHPMPEIDPDIEPIEGDSGEQTPAPSGGGSVAMVYTKAVTISLSSDKATIFYQNPASSNHSVVLELYIVSGDEEYFIGKTGLIPAGSAIYELNVSERSANIREGTYTGLYRVIYYEPTTGVRAMVGSDITGVSVVVTE